MSGSARPRLAVAAVAVAMAAGCTAETAAPSPSPPPSSPFAGCADLASGSSELPAVELPCFTGGAPVRLNGLRGPAVLNVWGSWCGPCRQELPMVQHLADRSAGRLTVVGVDTRDSRDAAASFGADQKITFPMLFDPDQRFLGNLGRANVPLTVFVDAAGRTYVQVQPLDPDTLTDTVRQHTGVTVTP
jgi:cytochrome c biogenesis protein CcmG, thiol:disulfide interchange protein DsbE